MADEHQFIENGLQRTQIDEFFSDELSRAGYGGMDVAKTPMGTQIVLKAEKPGMVIGKGGKNIRKITTELEERFDLDDPQIDVQEVDEPDLNAQIVADRLANALERGWYFRKAGHTTIDRIMDSGALGAEIVLSGKVTGARSRVEKFNRGYIKHNGEPAEEIVDHGIGTAVMKLGTIGVQVKIIPPNAELPDDFEVYEDMEVEDFVEEPEGDVEELLEEPDEADEPDAATGTEAEGAEARGEAEEAADIEEEVVEEEIVQSEAADESDAGQTKSGVSETAAQESDEDIDDLEDAEEDLDEDVAAEAEELVAEMEGEGDADADEEGE
ncbi:30S ribosomal protein S3 [Natronomonas salina]|uniref:30S ribosomal protein S3 n=1 Tax=Natronomonas salina TaxID=1710540 RepID=UPI0015B66282|nr:30S ribosomal protein S3 [Natronomonas salina]QLD90923.1 30S ribosomal protein S3 [Natronomonas salina]